MVVEKVVEVIGAVVEVVGVVGVGTALPTKRKFLPVTLGEGGPYHPPLWQRQRKEDGSCGNCGKTRSGVVGVIEVLAIVLIVDGNGNY